MLPQGNGFELGGFGPGHDVQVVWEHGGSKLRVDTTTGKSRLIIPEGFDFDLLPDKGAGEIRKWLMGHPLHPYIFDPTRKVISAERAELGEDTLHLKEVQEQGMRAASQSIEDGRESFLFVAPTGTGKSEVLTRVLADQINRNSALDRSKDPAQRANARRLQILVADKNNLVDQLYEDAVNLRTEEDFVVYRWGGNPLARMAKSEPLPPGLADIIQMAEESGKQVVLVTTVQSLVPRIKEDTEFYSEALRGVLATVAFDEAHHAGASETLPILKQLIDRNSGSKAFLYGTTATPTHREVELISDVFNGQAFWAYLDDPETFRAMGGQMERGVSEVIDQLQMAINAGELNSFLTEFIDPDIYQLHTGAPLFISAKEAEEIRGEPRPEKKPKPLAEDGENETEDERGRRIVMDPRQYKNVINRLRPAFEKHERGFITVSTQTEAKAFTKALREAYADANPKPTFAYLHSKMSPDEKDQIKNDFRTGKIQFLVTVKMMDEGINVPDLTLFADLTRTTSPKQLLQRIGRILRLSVGKKTPVDVLSFQKIDDIESAQLLLDLNNISHGESVDADRLPPTPKSVANSEKAPVDRGDLASIEWTSERLRDFKSKLFFHPRRGDEAGQDEAVRLISYFSKIDRELDSFARPGNGRIDPTNFNYSEQVLHNALDGHLGKSRSGAAGHQAFFSTLSIAPKHVRDRLKHFQEGWEKRQKQMKTSQGLAELLVDFSTRYNRAPDSVYSREEQRIFDRLQKSKGELVFWERVFDLAATQRGELNSQVLEKFLRVRDRLQTPTEVANWVSQFFDKHKRLPTEAGTKFEAALAKAMVAVPSFSDSLKNSDALHAYLEFDQDRRRASALAEEEAKILAELEAEDRLRSASGVEGVTVREAPATDPSAPKSKSKATPSKPTLKVLQPKWKTKIERVLSGPGNYDPAERAARTKLLSSYRTGNPEGLMEPANLRRVLGEVPLPEGQDPDEVVVAFRNAKQLNGGRRALADYYKLAAQTAGFQVLESAEQNEKDSVVVTFKGKGVSQYFMGPSEIAHHVLYKIDGKNYYSDVTVELRPTRGGAAVSGGRDPNLRRVFKFQEGQPTVHDEALGVTLPLTKSNAFEVWKQMDTDLLLREIERRIN